MSGEDTKRAAAIRRPLPTLYKGSDDKEELPGGGGDGGRIREESYGCWRCCGHVTTASGRIGATGWVKIFDRRMTHDL